MSKIADLLMKLCPDGVSYKKVADICIRHSGLPLTAGQMREIHAPNGEVRIFAGGQTIADVSVTDIKGQFIEGPGLIVKSRGIIDFEYWSGRYSHKNELWSYKPKSDLIDLKYLYYFLKTKVLEVQLVAKANSVKMPQIKVGDIDGMRIPVPPIAIQHEIVLILDKFTDLEADLEAEYEARKLQLGKYRDDAMAKLDDSNSSLMTLNDCAGIFDGTHQTPTYISEGVKFVSVENIDSLSKSTKFVSHADYQSLYRTKPQRGDLLMTRIGSVGRCAVIDVDEPLAYYVSLALIKPQKDLISSSFIKHFLESRSGRIELDKRTLHHAVPLKINLGDIGKVMIRVPDLETQSHLTTLFDKFEELLHSSITGISAELNGRRRQHEYYRGKLLTFKELQVA
jgi:type I restriction enzyme S subunit